MGAAHKRRALRADKQHTVLRNVTWHIDLPKSISSKKLGRGKEKERNKKKFVCHYQANLFQMTKWTWTSGKSTVNLQVTKSSEKIDKEWSGMSLAMG